MEIQYGPWTTEVDVEATRLRYQKRVAGGSDRCTCYECQNFATLRQGAYPAEFVRFLERLGADQFKETEVHHYGRLPSKLHIYRGWFHVVGRIEHGPDAWVKADGNWQRQFHRSSPSFEAGLHAKHNAPDCPEDFLGVPCVEVDYYVQLPWNIDLPEADRAAEAY